MNQSDKPRSLYWLFLPMCLSFIGSLILDYKLRGDKVKFANYRKMNWIVPFIGILMYEVLANVLEFIVKFLTMWAES